MCVRSCAVRSFVSPVRAPPSSRPSFGVVCVYTVSCTEYPGQWTDSASPWYGIPSLLGGADCVLNPLTTHLWLTHFLGRADRVQVQRAAARGRSADRIAPGNHGALSGGPPPFLVLAVHLTPHHSLTTPPRSVPFAWLSRIGPHYNFRSQVDRLDAFLVHHPRGDPVVLADQLAAAVQQGSMGCGSLFVPSSH